MSVSVADKLDLLRLELAATQEMRAALIRLNAPQEAMGQTRRAEVLSAILEDYEVLGVQRQ
ncbi:MAG: hypothetical protein AAGI03_01990 [Pseudomonadota bacterium]